MVLHQEDFTMTIEYYRASKFDIQTSHEAWMPTWPSVNLVNVTGKGVKVRRIGSWSKTRLDVLSSL